MPKKKEILQVSKENERLFKVPNGRNEGKKHVANFNRLRKHSFSLGANPQYCPKGDMSVNALTPLPEGHHTKPLII